MKPEQIGGFFGLALILCISSSCDSMGRGKQIKNDPTKPIANVQSDNRLYYLDINSPTISQPIEPSRDQVEGAKFVQVEVVEVLNPRKYALTFDVYYQPSHDAKIQLGSFSLYPADNPGKFIVATQGKVKKEGSIVLSMVIADKVDPGTQVKVGIKRIRFLK